MILHKTMPIGGKLTLKKKNKRKTPKLFKTAENR